MVLADTRVLHHVVVLQPMRTRVVGALVMRVDARQKAPMMRVVVLRELASICRM